MPNYSFNFRLKGISFSPARENAQMIYKALRKQTAEGERLPRVAVTLVPEPDNRYDQWAIQVYAMTQLHGRVSLGHVPARRLCPFCDSDMRGSGYPAYGEKALNQCPEPGCGTILTEPMNVQLFDLLTASNTTVEAYIFFVGGDAEGGKENLGAVCHVNITVDDSADNEKMSHEYDPSKIRGMSDHLFLDDPADF